MVLALCLCPCFSLQESVKVLAIIDAILSTLNLILYILELVALAGYSWGTNGQQAAQIVAVFLVAIYLLSSIIQILIAAKLYSGGINKNYQRCKFWLKITYVLVILQIIGLIVDVSDGEFKGFSSATSMIDLIYKVYEMLVVSLFLTELENRHEHVANVDSGVGQPASSSPHIMVPCNGNVNIHQNPYAPTTTELSYRNQDHPGNLL